MSICRRVGVYLLLPAEIQFQLYGGPLHQLSQQRTSVGFAQKLLKPENLLDRVQDRPDLNGKAPTVDRVIKDTESDNLSAARRALQN
jgi:hypothetical protein